MTNYTEIENNYDSLLPYFAKRIETWHENGSGLKVNNIVSLTANIGKTNIMRAGKYIDLTCDPLGDESFCSFSKKHENVLYEATSDINYFNF